jgi:hypothetical protein
MPSPPASAPGALDHADQNVQGTNAERPTLVSFEQQPLCRRQRHCTDATARSIATLNLPNHN